MSIIELVAMSEPDARKLTERIRLTARNYEDARKLLQEHVAEAKAGNAHVALGYASWTAYLSEVLGEEPMRLARGERQEMVQMLSAEGMSTRAIAPIVGASKSQVANDLEAGVQNWTPEPANPVQGLDGKTYTVEARREVARVLADEGLHSDSIAPILGVSGRTARRDVQTARTETGQPVTHKTTGNEVIARTANLLDGMISALATVTELEPTSTDEAQSWEDDLTRAIKELTRIRKLVKGILK